VPGPGTPRTGTEALRPPFRRHPGTTLDLHWHGSGLLWEGIRSPKPDQNAEKPGMVPSYQFICQAREPIVFKQPEQEMLPIARWTPTMSAAVK
jgi:hypothetical protein